MTILKRIWAILLTSLLVFSLCGTSAFALDDDEYGGYAADTLTIKVGYFGGPYYEKKAFALDELWNMDLVYADYTFIDEMPSVVIDHVVGVRLADVMAAAGIDLNSIRSFYFWTRDKQSDYYTSYSKVALIDTPRYCFYSLPENFDTEEGVATEGAMDIAVRVDTVLALADDWNRTIAGATFGSDYMNLNTNTRFRLIFGQTDVATRTAGRSAKWIHEIVVELGGAPTLTLDASVLEGEVGSVLRTQASAQTADEVIAQNMEITWSTSDASVATVDQNGNITVRGEGTATITASFGGATASLTVNGTPGGAGKETELPKYTDQPGKSDSEEITPVDTEINSTASVGSVQLLKPITVTENQLGGVQNWREEEMSKTATELPNIEMETPSVRIFGITAVVLFVGSIIVYTAVFYKNIVGRQKKR